VKIGFDVSQTGRLKAGCGYFADSLIRHLTALDTDHSYALYPTFGNVYWDPDWVASTYHIRQPNVQRGLGHKTLESMQQFWSHPPPHFEAQLGHPDLIHANNFFCPVGLSKAALVYTLYDLSFIEHPEWTTEPNRVGCFTGVFNASLYADFIIAISAYSRHHFLDVFPHYPEDRIGVIHPASRFDGPTENSKPASLASLQADQFWLNVGTLEPRKNHHHLLQAYARFKAEQGSAFPLVLTGSDGWLMGDFHRWLDDLGLQQDVITLGYVDDTILQWLYQHCFAFVYPSFFEGFGLPVLEAMSLGAAVIASNVTSLPEIVETNGILVDPHDVESICHGMRQLATDPLLRTDLRDRAQSQAAKFSWSSAARETLACYQEVLSAPRRSPSDSPL
jgi:glycosyltransferase involved in cell wall biosynthesis